MRCTFYAFTACLTCIGSMVACAQTKVPPATPSKALVASASSATTEPSAGPIAPADLSISLASSGVSVNGAALKAPSVDDVERFLGPADRVEELANRLHVFERYGIVAYEPYNGRVDSITIYFVPEDFSFMPKHMYSGHVDLDGKPMDATTPLSSLPKERSDADYTPWNMRGEGFSLYIPTDPGQTKLARLSLTFTQPAAAKLASHPREAECKSGSPKACLSVSLAYESGDGVAKDETKAAAFAKLSCDQGDAMGCFMFGNHLRDGSGVARSASDAKLAYKRGCKLGLDLACEMAK